MMPAPFSEDLRWRVIWFVHVLQHSVPRLHFSWAFLKEQLSVTFLNFLVAGNAKSETIGRSYEETRNVFQLRKAWVSFVFGVKNAQTNVHSWCIHFHERWTQLMKFCLSNSVTTVLFGRATSVWHSPFSSDNLYWNSCIYTEMIKSRLRNWTGLIP